jgi:hypothetical protein
MISGYDEAIRLGVKSESELVADCKETVLQRDDLAMLLRRTITSKHFGDCELKEKIKDYLSRKNLQGSILREEKQ